MLHNLQLLTFSRAGDHHPQQQQQDLPHIECHHHNDHKTFGGLTLNTSDGWWGWVVHITVTRAAPGVLLCSLYKGGHTFYVIWLVSITKMPVYKEFLIAYFDVLGSMCQLQCNALIWHKESKLKTYHSCRLLVCWFAAMLETRCHDDKITWWHEALQTTDSMVYFDVTNKDQF